MGTPPGRSDHERAKRGKVVGWSPSSVRRHTRWLYSIDAPELDGVGIAATLTLRDCPPDQDAWRLLVKAWMMRVERAGAIRLHWVVEWTRRGVPHLHAAVYFPAGTDERQAIVHVAASWLAIAHPYGSTIQGQDAKRIDGTVGWLAYLSKHAARGVRHYQRAGKPAGWETTGRLWGHRGAWPESEPIRLSIDRPGSFRLRRWVRAWRIADARAALRDLEARPAPSNPQDALRHAQSVATARRRIVSARTMLKRSEGFSAVQGVSEWVPESLAFEMVGRLAEDGHGIIQQHRDEVA